MTCITACLLFLGETGFSANARASRSVFEHLIDIKLEKDRLVFRADASGSGRQELFQAAASAFGGFGRIQVRYENGSTSRSGGGSGSVAIRFGLGPAGGDFQFDLEAPDGSESLSVKQGGQGDLSIQFREGRRTISYVQSQGKCQLKVHAGGDAVSVSRPTFSEVFKEDPEAISRQLIGLLEAFFDQAPRIDYSVAPPGKALFQLRDGSKVVGELKLDSLPLRTAYGTLNFPRDDLRRIDFASPDAPPGEAVVFAKRFSPRGKLGVDVFEVVTPYGDLRIEASDISQAHFGK